MTVFLQSLGSQIAKAVTKPFNVPIGDENTWSDIFTKEFDANSKAHYALLQALNDGDIIRVIPVSYTHLRAHETPEHLVCEFVVDDPSYIVIV